MHVKWLAPMSCGLRGCVHACGLRRVILVHLLLIIILISIESPDLGIVITPLLHFAVVSLHTDRSGGGAMSIAIGRYKSGHMSTDTSALIMYK